jgi:hypothetical protein
MDSATRWMSMNRAPVFDVSSMFLRPGESAEFKSRQNIEQRDYTNQANLYNYASDPETEWRNQMAGLAGQVGGAMVNYLGTGLTKQIGASGGPGATPYTDALLGTSAGFGGNKGG